LNCRNNFVSASCGKDNFSDLRRKRDDAASRCLEENGVTIIIDQFDVFGARVP